jgi:hypothetical protein
MMHLLIAVVDSWDSHYTDTPLVAVVSFTLTALIAPLITGGTPGLSLF